MGSCEGFQSLLHVLSSKYDVLSIITRFYVLGKAVKAPEEVRRSLRKANLLRRWCFRIQERRR